MIRIYLNLIWLLAVVVNVATEMWWLAAFSGLMLTRSLFKTFYHPVK
jgi:hypothetical protein